jgi:hypothetical protein
MRFFRREVEVALKMLGVIMLIALILLPLAWGYEQGRQARRWQSVACAYRVDELTRRAALTLQAEPALDACAVLARLGFTLEPEGFAPPLSLVLRRVASRN